MPAGHPGFFFIFYYPVLLLCTVLISTVQEEKKKKDQLLFGGYGRQGADGDLLFAVQFLIADLFFLHETHPNIIIQQKHIPLLSNTIYNHTPDKYMHRRNAGLYTNTKKSGRSPP